MGITDSDSHKVPQQMTIIASLNALTVLLTTITSTAKRPLLYCRTVKPTPCAVEETSTP